MPYKQKRTPRTNARARATQRAQARTRQQIRTPGKMAEGGTTGYAAVKLAQAGVKAAAKAVGKQNKAARTYISKKPLTAAQKAAAAKSSARMKNVNSKARVFNKAVGSAAAGTGVTAYILGQETQKRATDARAVARKREEQRARNKTAAQRAKKK